MFTRTDAKLLNQPSIHLGYRGGLSVHTPRSPPAVTLDGGEVLATGWCRVVLDSAGWLRVVQGGAGQCRVAQGGAGGAGAAILARPPSHTRACAPVNRHTVALAKQKVKG